CGCARQAHWARLHAAFTRHGHARGEQSPTYRSWLHMLTRCKDGRNPHYGGRGITVCDPWPGFENFLADMGERPPGKSLDRVDVEGHYAPENCRWATQSEQVRNRRRRR